jgi:hypothetical protein
MSMNDELVRSIERRIGRTADQIRYETVEASRARVEAKYGEPMQPRRWFPVIGRGHVLGKFTLSHQQVEGMLDHALR